MSGDERNRVDPKASAAKAGDHRGHINSLVRRLQSVEVTIYDEKGEASVWFDLAPGESIKFGGEVDVIAFAGEGTMQVWPARRRRPLPEETEQRPSNVPK